MSNTSSHNRIAAATPAHLAEHPDHAASCPWCGALFDRRTTEGGEHHTRRPARYCSPEHQAEAEEHRRRSRNTREANPANRPFDHNVSRVAADVMALVDDIRAAQGVPNVGRRVDNGTVLKVVVALYPSAAPGMFAQLASNAERANFQRLMREPSDDFLAAVIAYVEADKGLSGVTPASHNAPASDRGLALQGAHNR